MTASLTLLSPDTVKRRVMVALELVDPVTGRLAGAGMRIRAPGFAPPSITRAGADRVDRSAAAARPGRSHAAARPPAGDRGGRRSRPICPLCPDVDAAGSPEGRTADGLSRRAGADRPVPGARRGGSPPPAC
ncbi:MAG: hypothetical protein WDN24_20150 [Sphingomonas sp.]